MHECTTLGNGLRVVTSTMPNALSISVAIYLGSGSRHEAKAVSGISHFAEHMLFKGTDKRPTAMDISVAIEGIGGVLNAETGKELTVYWAKVARPHFLQSLDVLSDIILHSAFDLEEVEKERQVILEELSMTVDLPQDWVSVLIDQAMWGDQPLGWDVGGTKESVGGITRHQLVDFTESQYVPANAVVSIAGAASHRELVESVQSLLGAWQPREVQAFPPRRELEPPGRILLDNRPTEQAHISLGAETISYNHPQRFALDLANVILGEGMCSRLFQEIREKRGLAYDVHSYVNHYRDTGALLVYAGVDPGRIDQTITAVLEEVRSLGETVSSEEITRAKEYWKGRMLLRLEDTRGYASWMGGQELLLGHIYTLEEVMAIVDSITAEQVRDVVADIFRPERLRMAIVGPFGDKDHFSQLIEAS